MKKENRKDILLAAGLLAAFLLWTAAVLTVDVQPIGPHGSAVGFSALNGFFHRLTGVNMTLYIITDWLGLVPIGVAGSFGCLGLMQWISRRSIRHVDASLFVLGGFYIIVIAAYLFFECVVVNYRPVLIDGMLEASYPSSTTLLVLCVMPTAGLQLRGRIHSRRIRQGILAAVTVFTSFMVIGRLLSGVHWVSDIIGGALLSTGLVLMYYSACRRLRKNP